MISHFNRNKYGAKKVTIDGITFHSKKEGARYSELKMLERAGEISGLYLQPKFKIINGIRHNGKKLQDRYYIADFRYRSGDEMIVEDVKGYKTEIYRIKKLLFLNLYPQYTFRET